MENKEILLKKIDQLKEKYLDNEQDLSSFLDTLLFADNLSYWEYLHLDTLLTLQTPRTHFPDENVFIMFHQISELYFKLILNELQQIMNITSEDEAQFLMRLKRCVQYFKNLVQSFDVMVEGMDPMQFSKFRMALYPASGFQSLQFRLIELSCTDLHCLTSQLDPKIPKTNLDDVYEFLYWRQGSVNQQTGKKTLTLLKFEKKYKKTILEYAKKVQNTNIRQHYKGKYIQNREIVQHLKQLDQVINVSWPSIHLKSVNRYLNNHKEKKSTGGTNWKKYLKPNYKKIIFYPELWTENELADWGK